MDYASDHILGRIWSHKQIASGQELKQSPTVMILQDEQMLNRGLQRLLHHFSLPRPLQLPRQRAQRLRP